MKKRSIRDIGVSGKRVLVRVDFNVPLANGQVKDDTRIRAVLPTLRLLLDNGASVVLCSHLGRPQGPEPKYSLAPVAARLGELLGRPVQFAADTVGPEARAKAKALQSGEVLLVQTPRFEAGEAVKTKDEAGRKLDTYDPAFSEALACLGELFVNDAFGSSHRAHSSVVGVTHYLKPAVAGLLVEAELDMLSRVYNAPPAGFVVILGGAKVDDKIDVIRALLPKCETMLIGGAMTYAFMAAQGRQVGHSLLLPPSLEAARDILATAGPDLAKMNLPQDVHMAEVGSGYRRRKIVPVAFLRDFWEGLDIGPQTAAAYAAIAREAQTVFWNGPMGVFEVPTFAAGTRTVAAGLAESQGLTVVGGGDSARAIQEMGFADKVSHLCTGGGASLEFLAKGDLPGVAALDDA